MYQPTPPQDRKIPSTKTAVSHHHKSAQEAPTPKRGQPKHHTPTKIFSRVFKHPEHEHVNVREASCKRVNQTAKILNFERGKCQGQQTGNFPRSAQGDVGGRCEELEHRMDIRERARNESMTFRRRRKKTKSPQLRYCRDNFQCRPLSTCPVARVFKAIAWEHFTNARYLKHRNNWTLSY